MRPDDRLFQRLNYPRLADVVRGVADGILADRVFNDRAIRRLLSGGAAPSLNKISDDGEELPKIGWLDNVVRGS
jgi:hypothetical protein